MGKSLNKKSVMFRIIFSKFDFIINELAFKWNMMLASCRFLVRSLKLGQEKVATSVTSMPMAEICQVKLNTCYLCNFRVWTIFILSRHCRGYLVPLREVHLPRLAYGKDMALIYICLYMTYMYIWHTYVYMSYTACIHYR